MRRMCDRTGGGVFGRWRCLCANRKMAWRKADPADRAVPARLSSDVIARIVSKGLAERLGQQIVVDNRVGASATLGSEEVARAEPDGYTMGLANTTTHASATAMQAKPAYDPVKDFTPVVLIGSSPMVILATPKLPAKDIPELLALAKAKPGTLNYASAGPGSIAHLTGALLEKMGNVRMTHVPYRGTAQSVVDLMEGRIELLMGTIAPSLAHIRDGKMRALATTGAKRNAQLPDVPTVAEQGLAGYEAGLWTAFVLPAKAPAAIVERHQSRDDRRGQFAGDPRGAGQAGRGGGDRHAGGCRRAHPQ